MKHDHVILGIHVTDRLQNALEVQKVFTEYGVHIKTRLGLHEVEGSRPTPEGVVLIELVGGREVHQAMMDRLGRIQGIEVQEMVFRHA